MTGTVYAGYQSEVVLMKHLISRLLKKEEGSVIVIVAIAFTVFLGFVAIVTDIGLLYVKQNKVAHAVDAAALAGAQELPDNPANAVAIAKSYAQLNGLDPLQVTATVAPDNKSITVTSNEKVDLVLARLFGRNFSTVSASAKARVAPARSLTGAVPFSVLKQELHYGEEYVLKEGAGGVSNDGGRWHGWFGALDYTGGGGGASEYRETLKNGYAGSVSIGDVIDIESGNMSGPTSDGVNYRINLCRTRHSPECTWDSYQPDCPRVIYVPVVEQIDSRRVRVVGFAAFFLKGVEGQGHENNVVGYFIKEAISADSDESATDYGLHGIKLSE